MAVPRIARIHLVYQFIILTLLIFAISYNEILPDKRFLFLALIPIFFYQLIIVFCCTELLPVPAWFNWKETQNEVLTDKEQTSDNAVSGSSDTFLGESSKSPVVPSIVSPTLPRARLSTKKKKSPSTALTSDANTQTVLQDTFKKAPVFTKASARRSESTKSYCFTHRENRLEDDLDTKENIRSYKTRNWRSLQDQKGTKSQSNLKSPSHPMDEIEKVISPGKLETLEESIETDLSRSYSFPFRQKRQDWRLESEENSDIPVMSAWSALDYFGPSMSSRRRKSISTEAIDRELRLINSHFEQNAKNDFTQSMEVARETIIVEPAATKKGLKSSASFNKWKQGLASYFNKTKRDNLKTDGTKQEDNTKKPFFKELFVSKENLYQESEKKGVTNKRNNSSIYKLRNTSPTYISYENDYFANK